MLLRKSTIDGVFVTENEVNLKTVMDNEMTEVSHLPGHKIYPYISHTLTSLPHLSGPNIIVNGVLS
jgi:hypothetical protein